MQHLDPSAQGILKQVAQERFEVNALLRQARLRKGPSTGHHQGAKELERPSSLLSCHASSLHKVYTVIRPRFYGMCGVDKKET